MCLDEANGVNLLNSQWEIGVAHEARSFTFANIWSGCGRLVPALQSHSRWQFDHAAARKYSAGSGAGAQVKFSSKKLEQANAAWEFTKADLLLRTALRGHLRQ